MSMNSSAEVVNASQGNTIVMVTVIAKTAQMSKGVVRIAAIYIF